MTGLGFQIGVSLKSDFQISNFKFQKGFPVQVSKQCSCVTVGFQFRDILI